MFKTILKLMLGFIIIFYIMLCILGGTFRINTNEIYLNMAGKTIINYTY